MADTSPRDKTILPGHVGGGIKRLKRIQGVLRSLTDPKKKKDHGKLG